MGCWESGREVREAFVKKPAPKWSLVISPHPGINAIAFSTPHDIRIKHHNNVRLLQLREKQEAVS